MLLTVSLYAQQYSIDWYRIAGGGGTSTSGVYSVSGSIGQHEASGVMSGGNYSVTGGFWGIISVVQTAGAPTLAIAYSGSNVILSWPTNTTGFVLQSTLYLVPSASWSDASPGPVVVNARNTVTNGISGSGKFYRLVQ